MGERYASLAMYSFQPLRAAWEAWWSAVGASCPALGVPLRWDGDLTQHWTEPDCVLSHTCGYPASTSLAGIVRIVGAFEFDVPEAHGHRYRSVIVARDGTSLKADDGLEHATVAVNSDDSLSGWISLRWVLRSHGVDAPGAVEWTGSHLESVRAVADGRASLASIDSVTWAHTERLHTQLAESVHVVGAGPLVPSTPLVVPVSTPDALVDDARAAIAHAVDAAGATTRESLRITGFVPLDANAYAEIPDL